MNYNLQITLLLTLLIQGHCQDAYNDILRLQQTNNDRHVEGLNFNNNGDTNSQISNTRFQIQEEASNQDYNRDRGKNRKVYRIKNPFQNQQDDQSDSSPQDSDTSASNQYAGVQYSLPPEEFLQQMRAENQYHQQQLATQASVYSYTATPQPQYLYSTMSASYDSQPNNVQEPKSLNSYYNTNANAFQYSNANTYNQDSAVSTPVPTFLSTSSNQYIGTPANTYVSSSSPMYITSPPNLQQGYVSSPYSNIQAGTVDYNNNRVSTIGNNVQSFDNNVYDKKVQVESYSNSGNRYPVNLQNQYQNYPSSTISPISSPFSDEMRDNWQNNGLNYNNGYASHKSTQDLMPQYTSHTQYRQNNNQDGYAHDTNYDNLNHDGRHGGLTASNNNNNIYYSYLQPHNQNNNVKGHPRDVDQQNGQTTAYSHGDYGWKLDRRPVFGSEISTAGYSGYNAKSDNEAVSQVSFHMDTSRPSNYNQISKSSSEKLEAEEFIRAATKAHDNYKQQLEANRIAYGQYNTNALANLDSVNSYYANNNEKLRSKHEQSNSPIDYVTVPPYYGRENNLETKPKQSFDHDKAIKNIVPIDVSNVVQNSNSQYKQNVGLETSDASRYTLQSLQGKDQNEQNFKQYIRPTSESYYKDKNNIYSFSIKSQPEDYVSLSERLKQLELSTSQQNKPTDNALGFSNNKRYIDDTSQLNNYVSQKVGNQDLSQTSVNNQQNILQRNPISSDLAALLKFNDIPLRLTQNLNTDSLRLQGNTYDQSVLPSPLPVRINQNVEQHHVDVATDILNKLIASKQNSNRHETDAQNNNFLSTIHGFKVANPFNVDLKMVADMLKEKPVVEDTQMSIRDQYKPLPIKFDLPQLQQFLLKNDNLGGGVNNVGILPGSYFDIYNNGRYPYQGIKYSRSEEEPENIPIAESSNAHPIGAVIEEGVRDSSDISEEETESSQTDEDRAPKLLTNHRTLGERYRFPTSFSRHFHQRKYPKTINDQPHPVLKPPSHKTRSKGPYHSDKSNRKRRINKPKHLRFFKTEPLFEANTLLDESKPVVSTLLKPPPVMEDKSDVLEEDEVVIEESP